MIIEIEKLEDGKMRRCVSEEFIKFCNDKYPKLRDNITYRKLFMYICFGTYLHKETGNLAISYVTLARFADQFEEAKNRNFNSLKFLQDFKRDVLPEFTWSRGNNFEGCRSVDNNGLDAATRIMVAKEMGREGQKYYFDTGKLFSRQNAAKEKKTTLDLYMQDYKYFNLNETQSSIFFELKEVSLNGRIYSQALNKNINLIKEAIENIELNPLKDKITLEEKKALQYKILDAIREDPRIYYRPTPLGRTPRLHQGSSCVLGLKSTVRKAFCSGWTEADLVNSQFVILAAILDAPLCKAFIQSRQNLWKYLHNYATGSSDDPDKRYKSVYKYVIYGICFGTGKTRLSMTLKQLNALKLMDCPIIKELLEKREVWFKKIKSDGYIKDVWGIIHKIEPAGTKKDIYGNLVYAKARWEGSLAGTLIQSIEMEIIEATFEQQKKTGESFSWQIVLFQHDGIYISFNNKDRQKNVEEQIRKALKDRAEQVGKKLGLDLSGVAIDFMNL
jgi:hypothetical protein